MMYTVSEKNWSKISFYGGISAVYLIEACNFIGINKFCGKDKNKVSEFSALDLVVGLEILWTSFVSRFVFENISSSIEILSIA